MFIYNKAQTKNLRRILRKSQTLEERKVWNILKGKKMLGCRFLRQYGVKNYVLDFYCPEIKLAIEIDGGQHNNSTEKHKDSTRTNVLNLLNIKVIRFWNNEINNNLSGVYEKILCEIKNLLPTTPSNSPF
ncbi:MAG: endonuclease domain-containing protein [Candidatus Doudnabacteria bacterium]|nr:endonuclease domain-containing protein [Candidatus Doudnabacteria bacterium]